MEVNKESVERYNVTAEPGDIENFVNSQGHFILYNLPMLEEGTIDMSKCLQNFRQYLEKLNTQYEEAARERNLDHAMDNMEAADSEDPLTGEQ